MARPEGAKAEEFRIGRRSITTYHSIVVNRKSENGAGVTLLQEGPGTYRITSLLLPLFVFMSSYP